MDVPRKHTPAAEVSNDAQERMNILEDQLGYRDGSFPGYSQHYRDYPEGWNGMDGINAQPAQSYNVSYTLDAQPQPYNVSYTLDAQPQSYHGLDAQPQHDVALDHQYAQLQLYNPQDASSSQPLPNDLRYTQDAHLPFDGTHAMESDVPGSSNASLKPTRTRVPSNMEKWEVTSPGGTSHTMPIRVGKVRKQIDPQWLKSHGAYAHFGTYNQVERQGPNSLRDNEDSRSKLSQRGFAGGWERTDPEGQKAKDDYNKAHRVVPGSIKKEAIKTKLEKKIQSENPHLNMQEIDITENTYTWHGIYFNHLRNVRKKHKDTTWEKLDDESKKYAHEQYTIWNNAKNAKQ